MLSFQTRKVKLLNFPQTLSTIQLYNCYDNNAKFRDDLQAVNEHPPYVNPSNLFNYIQESRPLGILRRFMKCSIYEN